MGHHPINPDTLTLKTLNTVSLPHKSPSHKCISWRKMIRFPPRYTQMNLWFLNDIMVTHKWKINTMMILYPSCGMCECCWIWWPQFVRIIIFTWRLVVVVVVVVVADGRCWGGRWCWLKQWYHRIIQTVVGAGDPYRGPMPWRPTRSRVPPLQ